LKEHHSTLYAKTASKEAALLTNNKSNKIISKAASFI